MLAWSALAAGIAAAHAAPPHAHTPAIAAAAGLAAALAALALALARARSTPDAARRARTAALVVAGCALGAAAHAARITHAPEHSLAHALSAERTLLVLRGTVLDPPLTDHAQRGAMAPFARWAEPRTRFRLRVNAARAADGGLIPAAGVLLASIAGPADHLSAGDRVEVTGFASTLAAPINPGAPDRRAFHRQTGVVGSLAIASPHAARVLDQQGPPLARWVGAARQRAAAALGLTRGADESDHALLAALLLGRRDAAYTAASEPFARQGLGHVLAISGLHVGIAAGLLAWLVRLTGDRPRLEAAAVLLACAALLVLVPARAPIVRAAAGLGVFAVTALAGRRYDPLNTLAWIAAAVLLWRPADLFDPGYQLSFGVVAALITLTRPVRLRLFGPTTDPDHRTALRHAVELLQTAFAASLVAWAVGTPLVAQVFGVLSPIAALTALLAVPLVTLALAAGYAAIAVGLLLPGLADAVTTPALWAAAALAATVNAIDALPASSMRAPALSPWWTAAATAAVVWWLARADRPDARTVGPRERNARRACSAAVLAWAAAAWITAGTPRSTALRLDSLAVGDGAAHLLRSGRHALLVDCGSSWLGAGQRAIPNALRALRSPPVRTAIITHPDLDHYAALLDAADNIGLRRVLVGEAFTRQAQLEPEGPAAFLLARLEQRAIDVDVVRAGMTARLGHATVTVVGPPPGFTPATDNDASLVLLAQTDTDAGTRTLLLTGDIERDAIDALLAHRPDLPGSVHAMDAPHHGSARPFAIDFVNTIDPGVVVQSTGPSRVGDERWDDVRAARRWITTASDGAAAVTIHRSGRITAEAFADSNHARDRHPSAAPTPP